MITTSELFVCIFLPVLIYSQNDVTFPTSSISQNTSNYSLTTWQNFINETNSCKTNDSIPSNCNNVQARRCRCDEECSAYDDCCTDAEYRNTNQSEFSCQRTFFDGNIYMKDACPISYGVIRIANYCQEGNLTAINGSIFLQIPVVSANITYKNLFCALCDGITKFTFWDVAISPKNEVALNLTDNKVFLDDNSFWKKLNNGMIKNFDVHAILPEQSYKIRYCYDKKSPYSECINVQHDDESFVRVSVLDIPQFPYCSQIPPDNTASKKLCQTRQNKVDKFDELTYINTCFFQTIDGQLCLINSELTLEEFEFVDEETVFVYSYNSNFSSSEWSLMSNNSIYLCGTTIPETPTERWFGTVNSVISTTLVYASVVFIILYLIMYATTRKMRYPLARVISCYSVTLLITYVLFASTDWLSSCYIVAAVLHYLFLSCFSWLVVASYDCWRMVTAPNRIRDDQHEHSWKRFILYCCVGWILPLSITSVSVYFELSPVQSIPCPMKPGYGRLEQCFIAQNWPFLHFFQYPSAVMFLINIFFFLRVAFYVLCNMSSRQNISIFAKLALVTGLPWTIGAVVAITNGLLIRFVYTVLNSSQGIFIFLAFAYDRRVIGEKFRRINRFFSDKSDTTNQTTNVTFSKTDTRQASNTIVNEYF